MLSIPEATREEIENIREMAENGMELEDDRELWIWREYMK